MKLTFLATLLLAVQLCSSQSYNRCNNQRWNNEECNNVNQPWRNNQELNVYDYSRWNWEYFSSCKDILVRYPDTPSGYYFIRTGDDSYRKVFCEMDKIICGEKGWERFYYMDLVNNQTQDCPTSFIKSNLSEKHFCRKELVKGECTKANFPLQERQYHEVCGKISGYQYGLPTAFKPFDIENSMFYHDGIHFTYGKEEWHLWSYVVGAYRNYDENRLTKVNLRDLCPDVSPRYNWTIPYYIGNNYYCDSGLYKYNGIRDSTTFHNENRLWEGKDCKYPNFSCKRSGQPWFYTKLPKYMEDYIEIHSCFNNNKADVRFDNLEIYLR